MPPIKSAGGKPAPFSLAALNDATPWLEADPLFASQLALMATAPSSTFTLSYECTVDNGVTVFAILGTKTIDGSQASSDAVAAAVLSVLRRFDCSGVKIRAKLSAFTSGGPVAVTATYVTG